jgi:hypothetical protein
MTREEFMCGLAVLIQPRSPTVAGKQLCNMLPYLAALDDEAFAPDLLPMVASKLKRNPMLADVRLALEEALDPPPIAPARHGRNMPDWMASLTGDLEHQRVVASDLDVAHRADWSVISNVRHSVDICENDPRLLALLRGIVSRYAPQNLDLIPPLI